MLMERFAPLTFGPFRLDTGKKILWRDDQEVPLRPTPVEAGADLTNGFLMSYAIGSSGWGIGGGTGSGFSVTVTKNTGTEMEGTFSGELGSDSDPSKVTLASGYFHCKL